MVRFSIVPLAANSLAFAAKLPLRVTAPAVSVTLAPVTLTPAGIVIEVELSHPPPSGNVRFSSDEPSENVDTVPASLAPSGFAYGTPTIRAARTMAITELERARAMYTGR